MSRLTIMTATNAQRVIEDLHKDLERRIIASLPGLCPVDMASAFLKLCHAQTRGRCVLYRISLVQLQMLLEDVLEGRAALSAIGLIGRTARNVPRSADCAIEQEDADMVLKGVQGFRDDYEEHILHGRCMASLNQSVPCVSTCPVGVDISGCIALVREGRNASAVRLIRKDNPFPAVCVYICEHPYEARCRRSMLDDSINIRGIRRYTADHAGYMSPEPYVKSTGKRIAIVDGGSGGLSAAYHPQRMGYQTVVYEKRESLGGMLRYGIPNYRLPRVCLDEEIEVIKAAGVEVHTGVDIGKDIAMRNPDKEFDAVYLAIGAQIDKKVGIPGENGGNIISAVTTLREIGDDIMPDFKGKRVFVIGDGNVATDVARNSRWLDAAYMGIAHRRRQEDVTALPQEVEGALAEGCELLPLQAPTRTELDEEQKVAALWVQSQTIPSYRKECPSPKQADTEEKWMPCNIVVAAIGQGIEPQYFAEEGAPIRHDAIDALDHSGVENTEGIFAGGDYITGPATVIRTIAVGKVAAANIDEYLGHHYAIECDVIIPAASYTDCSKCGRIQLKERQITIRNADFGPIEYGTGSEEA